MMMNPGVLQCLTFALLPTSGQNYTQNLRKIDVHWIYVHVCFNADEPIFPFTTTSGQNANSVHKAIEKSKWKNDIKLIEYIHIFKMINPLAFLGKFLHTFDISISSMGITSVAQGQFIFSQKLVKELHIQRVGEIENEVLCVYYYSLYDCKMSPACRFILWWPSRTLLCFVESYC